MPRRPLLPTILLAGALTLAGAACDGLDPTAVGSTTPAVVDDRGVRLRQLRSAVADVAEVQATADDRVDLALEAARALDRSVARFLDPETLYDQGEAWGEVRAAVDAASFEGLREPYFELARAADRARTALARAEEDADDDWERSYFAAQDDVLVAVRDYAESADRVAQLLERHGPTYERFAEQNQSFTERRFFFRDADEAADAYATEVDGFIGDLVTAQQQLAEQVSVWRDAGVAVNDATADAREIYQARPGA